MLFPQVDAAGNIWIHGLNSTHPSIHLHIMNIGSIYTDIIIFFFQKAAHCYKQLPVDIIVQAAQRNVFFQHFQPLES